MAEYVLHVESWPVGEDVVDEFNRWYDEVHIPECLAVKGFVSATRYAPLKGLGPYMVRYEIEGDPEEAVKAISAASAAGRLNMSDTLRMDPVPVMRIMRVLPEHRA